MNRNKNRSHSPHLLTAITKPGKSDKAVLFGRGGHTLTNHYKNRVEHMTIGTFARKLRHHGRKSSRNRTHGIAALTNFDPPVVTKIYDIAPGGIAILSPQDLAIPQELAMDILIFDCLTGYEQLINQISGCIKSKRLVADSESGMPIWRYCIEFLDLDAAKQARINLLFRELPPTSHRLTYETYPVKTLNETP